ncbi:MAG: hypothetical protein H6766_05445 [Candidatus Peribacteria bacterium]|nr:MAG: hypothetical protein H6766_05445 [Candidatus Peribacteria bacterium]
MIATYTDEESDRFYVGTIIDAYQDDYVAYNFIFITDDSYQYNKRVKDFFQQIDSDEIERVFDSSPSFQASW